MFVILLIIIALIAASYNNSSYDDYDEYCKIECWSRRKPCCYQ